jgi:hypothetical protein
MKITKATIPADSLTRGLLPADYTDTYACEVDTPFDLPPDEIMIGFWTDSHRWIRGLFRLRDFLVRFVGLQGSDGMDLKEFRDAILHGGSYKFMSVPAKKPHETVVLMSDKHLDAYLSIHIASEGTRRTVSAITVVHQRIALGRVYFFFIRPFHSLIVRTMLRGAINRAIKQRG